MSGTKQEPAIATYLHQKGRRLGLPVAGNFELTARCNFNCPMCYVHQTPQQLEACGKRELTADEWLKLAGEAKEQGMLFALLTGGEPLIRKDFFDIYDGMKKMGIMLSINSNGSMLSGRILERFLQDPPFRFNISLYGGSNETYTGMCGLPVYDQVRENIRALREAGVQVSLNLSITPWNKDDLAQIYADAVALDVNVKASSYMYPPIRLEEDTFGKGRRLSAEEAGACMVEWDTIRFTNEELQLRAENMRRRMADCDAGCPMEADEGIRCRAGSTSFWVTWDGRMLPCGMMTEPEVYPLETGFRDAWRILREKTAMLRTPKECTACSMRELCGVCAAVCVAETGRFDGVPKYLCQKTEHQIRLLQSYCGKEEV